MTVSEDLACRLLLLLSTVSMVRGECLMYKEPEKECHPCSRQCIKGEPMTCYYHFKVEEYYSMSKACYDCPSNLTDCSRKDCVAVDGIARTLCTANRQIPGPILEVCEGDKVVVTLENCMGDASTSIHWHGILQDGTQYMDGVPYVTQCPIGPGSKFEVKFWAVDTGTHFWHGHTGVQRCDGLFGGIIVRQPDSKTIHRDLYDEDRHVLLINDWAHTSGTDKVMEYLHRGGGNDADTYLVNGRGRYMNGTTPITYTPLYTINVIKGTRYRLRMIHGGCYDCPFEVYIDNHNMTAIAFDGHEIEPVECNSMEMSPGERSDVVLHANQPIGNYWMRITGLMNCANNEACTYVYIHYKGAPCEEPNGTVDYNAHPTPFLEINSLNVARNTPGSLTMPEIRAHPENPKMDLRAIQEKPDKQIWMCHSFHAVDNPMTHVKGLYGINQVNSSMQTETPQINNISFHMPTQPLLSQFCSLDPNIFCNEENTKNCSSKYCECTKIEKVKLNSICEVIIIDCGQSFTLNHPFHLHGNSFRVVGMDTCNGTCTMEALKKLDKAGKLERNYYNLPPFKDTVHVPAGGYTILRFVAKNPGMWLFHCHLDIHLHMKMALVFQVGELKDFPPVPVGFPKCGDFNNKNKLCRKT